MIDIEKQVTYWREGAREDWDFGQDAVQRGKTRQVLFFIHLAHEKALKAHVCRVTKALAPKIHNLRRLAEIARLQFTPDQLDFLADMNV